MTATFSRVSVIRSSSIHPCLRLKPKSSVSSLSLKLNFCNPLDFELGTKIFGGEGVCYQAFLVDRDNSGTEHWFNCLDLSFETPYSLN